MAALTLRSAVGRPLTNSEVDANFSALNLELGQKLVASLNLLDLTNPAQARSNLGLGNVENKSSATIRGELTSGNVTSALGFTPLNRAGGEITGGLGVSGSYTAFAGQALTFGSDSTNAYMQSWGNRALVLNQEGNPVRIGSNTVLHAGNYTSYALSLTGGSISGGVVIDGGTGNQLTDATLYVTAANSNDWGIRIAKSATDYGHLIEMGSGSVYGIRVMFAGSERFRIGDSSQVISGNQILHASNFGSYSLPLSGGDMSGRIRMGTFSNSTLNAGEAWIGRALDRAAGTMTVQLGSGADRVFEVVDNAWSTVIFNAGMNLFTYKDNAVLHAANYTNYALALSGGSLIGNGYANSPLLRLNLSNAAAFVHAQELFSPGLTANQAVILALGVAGSTKNAGYIGYRYSGTAGSDGNVLTFGHWGNDHLMTLNGAGMLDVAKEIKTNRAVLNWFQWGGNPGGAYLHIKTSLWGGGSPNGNSQPTMSMFHIKGYTYDAQTINSMMGFHNWSGTAYNLVLTNNGSRAAAQNAYVSSDGYIVLVINTGTNYPGISIDYFQNYPYTYQAVSVQAYTSSNSTAGVY